MSFNNVVTLPVLYSSDRYLPVNSSRQIEVSGGTEPFTYSIFSGGGQISESGLYTADANTGDVTLLVTDRHQYTAEITLTKYAELTAITQGAVSGGTTSLRAEGGVKPYTFTKISGSGTISGDTFTASGAGTFDESGLLVTDAIGNTALFEVHTVGNPTIWLRIDELSSFAHGDVVTNWPDVSGNGNHATQSTPALQPTMYRNPVSVGPLGTALFLAGQLLWLPEFADSTDIAVILVGIAMTTGDIFFSDNGSTANEVFGFGSTVGLALGALAGDIDGDQLLATGGANSATTFSVYSWQSRLSSQIMAVYRDGTVEGTSAANPAFSTTQTYEGTHRAPSIGPMQTATISEILIFKGVNSTNQLKVECYLGTKYGITVAGC